MLPRRAMLTLGAVAGLSGCAGPWLPTEDATGTRTPIDGCTAPGDGGRVLCGDPADAWPASYTFHGRIAIASDGRVAAGHSGRVAVWDAGGRLQSLGGAVDGYGGLAWAGDWIAATRCDGTIDVIDPACGLSTLTLAPGRAVSPGLAGSPEGRVYASTLDVISCWDAATGRHLVSRQLQEATVWGLVPAGLLVSRRWRPLLLDPATLETLWEAPGTDDNADLTRQAWAVSAEGGALVGVSHGAVPVLLIDGRDLEAGTLGSDGAVPAVSADGATFSWVSINDGVWLADRFGSAVALPRPTPEPGGTPRKFASLAFSPDGATLYGLGFTGVARWDVHSRSYTGALETPPPA